MATIKTVKYTCPHCGRKAASLFGVPQGNMKYYGCTQRHCRSCNGTYVDFRIEEIGMYPKEETFPRWYQVYLGWLIYGVIVVVFIGVIAYQTGGLSEQLLGIGGGFLLGGCVAMLLTNLLMLDWRKRRWQEEYDNSLAYMASRGIRNPNAPSAADRGTGLTR